MEEHVALKKVLGRSEEPMGSPDTRDQVIDFVRRWNERTEIAAQRWRWEPHRRGRGKNSISDSIDSHLID